MIGRCECLGFLAFAIDDNQVWGILIAPVRFQTVVVVNQEVRTWRFLFVQELSDSLFVVWIIDTHSHQNPVLVCHSLVHLNQMREFLLARHSIRGPEIDYDHLTLIGKYCGPKIGRLADDELDWPTQ